MNDCANGDIRDLLPDLLHDRLSPSERVAVEAHVARCADCRAELALLADMRGTMSHAPAVSVDRIAAALPAYRAPVRRSASGWRIAAVIAFVAAGGTSLALLDRQSPARSDAPPPARSTSPATTIPAPMVAGGRDGRATAPTVAAEARGVEPEQTTSEAGVGELAVTGGALVDLTDGELASLLRELDDLDAVPSSDVEDELLLSPVDPRGSLP